MTTAPHPTPSPAAIRGRAIGASARKLAATITATIAGAVKTAGASAVGVAGLASIAVGAGMVYRPAGFIVGGALAVWVASLLPGGAK